MVDVKHRNPAVKRKLFLVPDPLPGRLLATRTVPPTTNELVRFNFGPVNCILVVFQSQTDISFNEEESVDFWERDISTRMSPLQISIYDASKPWHECDLEHKQNESTTK